MSDTKQNQQEHQTQFKLDDIVWSRVVGFPWWPSQILEGPDEISGKYKVLFLNDRSYAQLPPSKIVDYLNGREKYMLPKKKIKGFTTAYNNAEQLIGQVRGGDQEVCCNYDGARSIRGEQIQIQFNKEQKIADSAPQEHKNENQKIYDSQGVIKPKKIIKKQNNVKTALKPRKALQKKQYSDRTIQFVENLLQKYKFHEIEELQQGLKLQKQESCRQKKLENKKSHKCRKIKNDRQYDELEIRRKVIRKLSNILRRKGIYHKQNYNIATFLGNSLLQQKQNKVRGAHRALFQWIAANDHQNIISSYRNWHGTGQKYATGFTQGNSDSKYLYEE